MVVDTHVLVRVAKLGGLVEELWVLVVTGADFDGFAEILMVAVGEGGGGGSENLMGILTCYLFLFIEIIEGKNLAFD